MPVRKPITIGEKFNRLTVLREAAPVQYNGYDCRRVECKCDCGVIRTVHLHALRSGNTKSCGCLNIAMAGERATTHGYSIGEHSRTYSSWKNMVARCTKPHLKVWKYYGGRGITVCERWLKFENFLADMGDPPPGLTLDRVDNSRGYQQSNCAWVSRKSQSRNIRSNRQLTFNGETRCLTEWAERFGIKRGTLANRISRGWTVELALTTP